MYVSSSNIPRPHLALRNTWHRSRQAARRHCLPEAYHAVRLHVSAIDPVCRDGRQLAASALCVHGGAMFAANRVLYYSRHKAWTITITKASPRLLSGGAQFLSCRTVLKALQRSTPVIGCGIEADQTSCSSSRPKGLGTDPRATAHDPRNCSGRGSGFSREISPRPGGIHCRTTF